MAEIKVQDTPKFVSRAGYKLDHALKHFNIDVVGKICADFGCSTGGFTDCLLQRGAKKVFAIDTAKNELHWKLRTDSRVVVMEKINAIYVDLLEKVDFISIDTAWTKQMKILPTALKNLKPDGDIITLLKPHYEAMPHEIRGGKVIQEKLSLVVDRVKSEVASKIVGIKIMGIVESPITGEKGQNTEYLMWIKQV